MFVCMGVIEIHSSIQQIIGQVLCLLKVMKLKPVDTGKTNNTAGYRY